MFGASPDALMVTENGELLPIEIKCPWRWANGQEVEYVVDGKFVRKGDGHHHYFQIQLQMLLCKVKQIFMMIFPWLTLQHSSFESNCFSECLSLTSTNSLFKKTKC